MASVAVRSAFMACFLGLSAIGIYEMRILPTELEMPLGLDSVIENGHLNIPFQHVKIPQQYTGIKSFDYGLAILVAAFSHGPLRLDEDAYWQQIYFLIGFFPIIAIYTVEAFRIRNNGSVLSYTTIWAIFYQTIAGAFVIPLHDLWYVLSGKDGSHLRSGRTVPLPRAQGLLPGLVLGYLMPTAMMFWSGFSNLTKLYLIAYWQFTPLFVNVFISFFSRLSNSFGTTPSKIADTADTGYVKAVYLTSILASFATHVFTIYGVLTSNDPGVSLWSVLIPDYTKVLKSTGQDLHYIFQWDMVVIMISTLLWATYVVIEMHGQERIAGLKSDAGRIAALIPLHTLLVGPGGALAAVFWWRENALIELERSIKTKTN